MKNIDYSKLRTGQTFLVDNETDKSFFAKEIQKFQSLKYPADIARFHHAGKIMFVADQWWIAEEGRISGVVITPISEYLAKDKSAYMIREPLGLTKDHENHFIQCFLRDANKGHYKIGAIFNLAYHFTAYKITGRERYLNIGNQSNFVCSTKCEEWDNEVMSLFEKPFNMAPADYAVSKLYKTSQII